MIDQESGQNYNSDFEQQNEEEKVDHFFMTMDKHQGECLNVVGRSSKVYEKKQTPENNKEPRFEKSKFKLSEDQRKVIVNQKKLVKADK